MNTGLLSVMTSQSVPHQQRMSSKIQSLMVFAVSLKSKWYLGKCAREQWPCMKYLKPLDFGRCMVSMYILVSKGMGVVTTGGMRTLQVWQSWHMWQVLMNHAMLAERWGHQKQLIMCAHVVKSPWYLAVSWVAARITDHLLQSMTTLWQPCWSFLQRWPSFWKKHLV